MSNRIKTLFLFIGDIIALYGGLFLSLAIRYGSRFYAAFANVEVIPFTAIFALWLLTFFIAGLYDLRRLRDNLDFLKALWLTIATSGIISIMCFYAIPALGIAPKTNLLIFVVVVGIIETFWRRAFNRTITFGEAPNRILLIGMNDVVDEIVKNVSDNTQLGYVITAHLNETEAQQAPEKIRMLVDEKNINCIVVSRQLKRAGHLPATLYQLFSKGILVMDLPNFYESVMRKVPLADLEETWFLENIESAAQLYDPLKRVWEFVAAAAIGIVLLPVEILIALLVLFTSRGPVIYQQVRVGKNGKNFTLYKFRTMKMDAEKNGAQWATKGDPRVTAVGRFLRASHLDELPQLANILRGELSFVGPRPERPELVKKLETQIPYYETRLLAKPGVTGWAQLNHRADLDVKDVIQKLQYDIYYLKNRSLILDLAIIAKTLKSFFVNPE